MSLEGVARYLARTALEPALRDLALRDTEASFAGFDLSDEEREVLRRRDHEMHRLIADVLRATQGASTVPEEVPQGGQHPLPVTGRSLPAIEMWLQIVPVPRADATGASRLAHEVTLLQAPATHASAAPSPGNAPPGVRFRITVAPHATDAPGGSTLTYAATIAPLPSTAPDGPAKDTAGTPPASTDDAHAHHADARRAAGAVLAAAPGDRYARLLDLIRVLETEEARP